MSTLQELVVKFTGDASGLKTAIDRVQADLSGFAATAMRVGPAAAAAMAGAGVAILKSAGNAADGLDDLSKRLGVSYEALLNYGELAKIAGSSVEAFGASLTIMQRSIFNGVDAINELGLKTDELLEKTPDQQFQQIAESLALIENPTQRAALAMEIFGRSGSQILPMLDEYNQKMAGIIERNEKFGNSLSGAQLDAIGDMNDAVDNLFNDFQGLAQTVAAEFAPAVSDAADSFSDMLPSADDVREVIRDITDFARQAARAVEDIAIGMSAIKNPMTLVFGSPEARETGISRSAEDRQREYDRVTRDMERAMTRGQGRSRGSAIEGLGGTKKELDEVTEATKKAQKAQEDLASTITNGFERAGKSIASGADALEQLKMAGVDALSAILKASIEAKFAPSGGANATGGGLLSGMFDKVGKSIGSFFSGIKLFADGGVVNGPTAFPMAGGTMGVMGEAGAEAIMPLARGADGKLGVKSSGGQVVQNINITTGVQQTVRAEILRLMPEIRQAGVSGVREAQARGAFS